jgi:hypothetical protein
MASLLGASCACRCLRTPLLSYYFAGELADRIEAAENPEHAYARLELQTHGDVSTTNTRSDPALIAWIVFAVADGLGS